MKKFISTLLSLMFVITTICTVNLTAFAETTSKYWEPRPNYQDSLGCVNDEPCDGIYTTYNKSDDTITISYDGKGILTSWEFPTAKENIDYKIISQNGDSITISIISDYGIPYINALVNFENETATENKTEENSSANQTEQDKTVTENNETTTPSKQNTTAPTTKAAEAQSESNTPNKILIPSVIGGAICLAIVVVFLCAKRKKR